MKKLFKYIDESLHDHNSKHFREFNIIVSFATLISIVTIILETVQSLNQFAPIFTIIEWIVVIFFSFEYLARLTTSQKKFAYVFSFWGIADLLAIAPTFLQLGNLTFLKSVRILRILRLLRLLRLAKIAHIYASSSHEAHTQKEVNQQNIRIYFFALFSSIILSGCALYAVEHTQEAYSDIPSSMIQGAKILLGGLGQAPASTWVGEIVILIIRFIGLALFGILITIVGGTLNLFLFGDHTVNKK